MNSVVRFQRPGKDPASALSPAGSTPPFTTAPSEPAPAAAKRERDPRLDFFRGLGMMIILIAHIPFDDWALYIPARFGFSDATEMFVFQSGMASAIAFGGTYDRHGLLAVVRRVLRRIWQIYWAHIAVFITLVALMGLAGTRPDGVSYLDSLNLLPFVHDPAGLLARLMALVYVPNYFDILPMYMVLLALMPVMILGARLHPLIPPVLMAGLWLAAQAGLNLPAEPWSTRPWFFNPFGWQLAFFTGFFLFRGQLPVPRFNRWLVALALAVVLVSVPFAWVRFQDSHPFFRDIAASLAPLTDKTRFGLLRYVHFLALAYLMVQLAGERGRRLRGGVVRVLMVVGQQSLAVFVVGMVAAQLIGIALDWSGRTTVALIAGNLAGFAILIGTAYTARWFKSADAGR